jgi:hypothetical protein
VGRLGKEEFSSGQGVAEGIVSAVAGQVVAGAEGMETQVATLEGDLAALKVA